MTYQGPLLKEKELKNVEAQLDEDEGETRGFIIHFIDGDYRAIDGTAEDGSLGRLMNHSRLSPNAELKKKRIINPAKFKCGEAKPHLFFTALRDIARGEEIVWDYGETRKSILKAHPWLYLS